MREVRNAEELVDILTSTLEAKYVWFAPGDFTRYRVAYVELTPNVETANERKLCAFLVTCSGKTIMIEKPTNEWGDWTALKWNTSFGDTYIGWWAGIRPILAAMSWTPKGARNTSYTVSSATDIANVISH